MTLGEASTVDVARILGEQNPWQRTGEVPPTYARNIERPITQRLLRAVADDAAPRRGHLILGPRRVGKTTVMYQTVRGLLRAGVSADRLWWMRLDHPYLMREDPGELVSHVLSAANRRAGEEIYLFLDELVYAKDWDLWLKTFHDDHWPVRIVATSSATAALRDRYRESGIGRWVEHNLGPYQFSEYLELIGSPIDVQVADTLAATLPGLIEVGRPPVAVAEHRRRFTFLGGFPELLTWGGTADEGSLLLRSQQRLRDEAVERAIYKDIPQSFGIQSPLQLERLLYALAGQVGGVLSPSNVQRDLELAQPTFDRYVSYLEQTFLVFRTLNFAGSEAKVQRRGRKLYFVDGAVRTAALQRGLAPLSDPAEMGLLTENLAASALHTLSLQSGHRLYHWREGGDEVDFVLDHPSGPLAFEVSVSAGHATGGLRRLAEAHPGLAGRTYLVTPESPILRPNDRTGEPGSLPLDLFLVAVGRQADRAAEQRMGSLAAGPHYEPPWGPPQEHQG